MNIKNVVFDFGQVLVYFNPRYMTEQYVSDEEDVALLEEVIFDRLYWDRLDDGTITDEETLTSAHARLPERLWEVADKIYYNWIYNIPEIEGMRELIIYLKEKYNVRLFLLSNISKYFAAHSDEVEILKEFEKCVFSSTIGKVKPSKEIFDYLCRECEILPEESIFVDDNPSNIEGAKAFGLNAYLFDGYAETLKKYFDTILKK